MTVFEDLIVELKEENLLEETVISINSQADAAAFGSEEHDFAELIDTDDSFDEPKRPAPAVNGSRPPADASASDSAIEDIAIYQTVEHILTGIERSTLGKEYRGFDELNVKKALHAFQQASADPSTIDFLEATGELRSQVFTWQMSLAERDALIPVSAMRRYCESCQPALSAQALFALARFHRGLPFSEAARGKYEFIVTRLFSRQADGNRRAAICSREEMLSHLRSRFSDSSESYSHLYAGSVDIVPFVAGFDELGEEAKRCATFDDLVAIDYFGRLNLFKESTGEHFFVSEVTASVILCNIKILNRLSNMVEDERRSGSLQGLINRHAAVLDEPMSNATGRTTTLALLAHEEHVEVDEDDEEHEESVPPPPSVNRFDRELLDRRKEPTPKPSSVVKNDKGRTGVLAGFASANRWLLLMTVATVILSVGLYIWANYYTETTVASANVQVVDVANSEFKDFLKEGRISTDTFYAITQPSWDALTRENQEQAVEKIYRTYSPKGCKRVSLINNKGQAVAFASEGKVNVFRQQ